MIDAGHRLHTRGSSQGGLRQYNVRVVLHAVRLHGALPAAEIARLSGLTAQTVSLIGKQLLDEGLLVKGAPVRGKVGQPSVPLSLSPDGAFAIGIKVGRRRVDTLLVDFTGAVRARWSLDHRYPDPDEVLAEIGRRFAAVRRKLGPGLRDRVQGVGLAAPLGMGGWHALLGMPQSLAARWAGLDLREAVAAQCEWPVEAMKDTAAACVAELVEGRGRALRSFLYVFVDTFIGGGLVIDGHLRTGAHGNAGAVGSMPVGLSAGPGGRIPQLLSVASLHTLEQAWTAAGLESPGVDDDGALRPPWKAHTDAWVARAAPGIAQAVHGAACLLDLDGVIVDGACGRELLAALLEAVERAGRRHDWEGVIRPPLLAGTMGPDAGALGGALLPLWAAFAPDRDLFIKDPANAA